jgi:transcriptional regulator with XRE-family HTH domain
MITLQAIGKEIHDRRQAVGLTQERLAKLSNLSRQTVQRLEAGTIEDLGFQRLAKVLGVLGLSFDGPSTAARKRKNGLWMAAQTSSVSYRTELNSQQLQQALTSGQVPSGLESNILHFLEEAPTEVVVMAVEEAAQQQAAKPAKVWSNIVKMAKDLGARRYQEWA